MEFFSGSFPRKLILFRSDMSTEREKTTSTMDSSPRSAKAPEKYADKLAAMISSQVNNVVSQSSGSSGEDLNQDASSYLAFVESQEVTCAPTSQSVLISELSSDALVGMCLVILLPQVRRHSRSTRFPPTYHPRRTIFWIVIQMSSTLVITLNRLNKDNSWR